MPNSAFSLNSRELPKEYAGARAKKRVGNNNPTRASLARPLRTPAQATPLKLRISAPSRVGEVGKHKLNNLWKIETVKIRKWLETSRFLNEIERDFVSETSGGYVEVANQFWNIVSTRNVTSCLHIHMFSAGHGRYQVTPMRLPLP